MFDRFEKFNDFKYFSTEDPGDNQKVLSEDEIDKILDDPNTDIDKFLDSVATGKELVPENISKDNTDSNIQEDKKESKEVSEGEAIENKDADNTAISNPKKNENNVISVNDDYIKSQPTEVQEILRGIKGDTLSQRALNNYINSQRYIQSLKQQQVQQPEVKHDVKPIENDVQKQKLVIEGLKQKYPDMPNDPKDLIDWERDLNIENPRKYREYVKDLDRTEQAIEQNYEAYNNLKSNWETLAERTINSDLDKFRSKLKSMNLNESDLGIDLKLNENRYNEYLFNNILFSKDDKGNQIPNPNVVKMYNNEIAVIQPGQVYNILLDQLLPSLIAAKSKEGYKQGFKQREAVEPEPSMSNNPNYGQREKIEVSAEDFDNAETSEQIEKLLDKARKKILNK